MALAARRGAGSAASGTASSTAKAAAQAAAPAAGEEAWALRLVNANNPLPDDFTIDTASIPGYDSRLFDARAAADLTAMLEAFFDYDSGTFESCSGFLDDIDQTQKCASVCKEIIDQKYLVTFSEEFFRNNNVIHSSVCK